MYKLASSFPEDIKVNLVEEFRAYVKNPTAFKNVPDRYNLLRSRLSIDEVGILSSWLVDGNTMELRFRADVALQNKQVGCWLIRPGSIHSTSIITSVAISYVVISPDTHEKEVDHMSLVYIHGRGYYDLSSIVTSGQKSGRHWQYYTPL